MFLGFDAGLSNVAGNYNLYLGDSAGINNSAGTGNIYLMSSGSSTDNSVTRIGLAQRAAYISGIYNVSLLPGYQQVIIDSTGHLGSAASTTGDVTGNCATVNYITKWLGNTQIK